MLLRIQLIFFFFFSVVYHQHASVAIFFDNYVILQSPNPNYMQLKEHPSLEDMQLKKLTSHGSATGKHSHKKGKVLTTMLLYNLPTLNYTKHREHPSVEDMQLKINC